MSDFLPRPSASGRHVAALRGELMRYGVLGAANTAATTAVFYGLSNLVATSVAFTITYLGALALLAALTPRFVFRARPTLRQSGMLGAWYLFVYVAGLAMIRLLDSLGVRDRLVVTIATVCVTSPLSFAGARVISRRSSDGLAA